jgi:ATP-dependent helicase/nuclease subunit A
VPKFRLLRIAGENVPAWVPGKMLTNAMTSADDDRIRTSTEEEYRRLLYVGMTRAADRLIVCGYRGKIDNPDTWQSMISKALAADEQHCSPAEFRGSDGEWGGFKWRLPAALRTGAEGGAQGGGGSGQKAASASAFPSPARAKNPAAAAQPFRRRHDDR